MPKNASVTAMAVETCRPSVGDSFRIFSHDGSPHLQPLGSALDKHSNGTEFTLCDGDVVGLVIPNWYSSDAGFSGIEQAVYRGPCMGQSGFGQEFRFVFTDHPGLSWRYVCEFAGLVITVGQLAGCKLCDQVVYPSVSSG